MKIHLVIDPIKSYKGVLPEMIHSDRDSQYRSYEYRDLIKHKNILHSMSEIGTQKITPSLSPIINPFNESSFNPINTRLK